MRFARRVHRGQLDEAGHLYIEQLERVAGLVVGYGGSPREEMAAWLRGIRRAAVSFDELPAHGVPRSVVGLLQMLDRLDYEPDEQYLMRIGSHPRAALVIRAERLEGCRPQALAALSPSDRQRRLRWTGEQLTMLGQPLPEVVAAAQPWPGEDPASSMLAALEAGNPNRWRAVQDLGSIRELRAAPALIDAFLRAENLDPDWTPGRSRLYMALFQIGRHRQHLSDPAWLQTLLGLLDHESPTLRSLAVESLRSEPEYRPLIIRALHDPSPSVISSALQHLTWDDVWPAEFDRLVVLINQQEETWSRRQAIRLLAGSGDDRAWAEVVAAAAATGIGLSAGAERAIAAHPPVPALIPPLIALLEGTALRRENAAFLLGEWHCEAAIPALMAIVRQRDAVSYLVMPCIHALGKIGSVDAEPALIEAAEHRVVEVRIEALLALQRIGAPSLVEVALRAADDIEPEVRERAIRVLSACQDSSVVTRLVVESEGLHAQIALRGLELSGDERAVPTLLRIFRTSGDRRTRHLAGRALVACARRHGRGRFSVLSLSGYRRESATLRAACWVAGEIGDRAETPSLVRALTNQDELVRARAAAALGKLADPAAAEPLHEALADPAARVRAASATALGRIALKDAVEWLIPRSDDEHSGVRAAVAAAVARLNTP